MINKLRRRHKEEESAARSQDRVVASTVERAQAHIKRMPLAGSRPLHNDETVALWKVKKAITEFFEGNTK